MIRKSISILTLILCIGLILTGCSKKTVVKEEPSLKAEQLAAERERAAKLEAERVAKEAEEKLRALRYDNIYVKTDDGTLGWPEEAPFDRIIITAGTPKVPKPLIQQLAQGGIIVAPVGERFSQQLIKVRKSAEGLSEEYHTMCVFVPLVGKYGWDRE